MAPATDRAVARARRRLVPFLFLLYVVAYLDRVNVGFAALQMNADLGLSPSAFGFGAGVFFLGYFLFEVPSNLMLHRLGARIWIARILISWGAASTAMAFLTTANAFHVLRFVLGAAEAGFFPGVILYLTYWFPARERARTVALFMTATAVAGLVGAPLSGALLSMDGLLGVRGWRWMYLIEGLPAIALGFVVPRVLTDRPEQADWLPEDERAALVAEMAREHQAVGERPHTTLRAAFADPDVWRLSALYFGLVVGLYGIGFWLPQIVKGLARLSDFEIGVVSAGPYLVAALGMLAVAGYSDRSGRRRGVVASSALVAAAGFLGAGLSTNAVASLAWLSLAALGVWASLAPFWSLPTAFLRGSAAAGGIAFVNSVGNLGGFAGPYVIGFARDLTGSFGAGLLALAAGLAAAAALAISLPRRES
jgi:ACS family tartrate transporter-like MFS transporter